MIWLLLYLIDYISSEIWCNCCNIWLIESYLKYNCCYIWLIAYHLKCDTSLKMWSFLLFCQMYVSSKPNTHCIYDINVNVMCQIQISNITICMFYFFFLGGNIAKTWKIIVGGLLKNKLKTSMILIDGFPFSSFQSVNCIN